MWWSPPVWPGWLWSTVRRRSAAVWPGRSVWWTRSSPANWWRPCSSKCWAAIRKLNCAKNCRYCFSSSRWRSAGRGYCCCSSSRELLQSSVCSANNDDRIWTRNFPASGHRRRSPDAAVAADRTLHRWMQKDFVASRAIADVRLTDWPARPDSLMAAFRARRSGSHLNWLPECTDWRPSGRPKCRPPGKVDRMRWPPFETGCLLWV